MQTRRSLLSFLAGVLPAALVPASASAALTETTLPDDLHAELKALRARVALLENRTKLPSLDNVPIDELYDRAVACGMVTTDQFNGLSQATIEPGTSGELRDTINRNCWARRLHLSGVSFSSTGPTQFTRNPAEVVVEAISIAGLPLNIGSLGMPLASFNDIDLGRRPLLVGQTVRVLVRNLGPHSAVVTVGLMCDVLNPYIDPQVTDRMMLRTTCNEHPKGTGEEAVLREALRLAQK